MNSKRWDEITEFDETLGEVEKKIILRIEKRSKTKCPYLKKEGSFFYYCGKDMPPEMRNNKITPFNPIYKRHVGCVEMDNHCFYEFQSCQYFTGKIKR